MLLLTARSVASDETRRHFTDAHSRIMSVAMVQRRLDGSRHGGQIEIGAYLSRLCDGLRESLVDDDRSVSIEVQADRHRIASAHAISMGLIVTELVINALKHAFVGGAAAHLIVVAYQAEEPGWTLAVSDNGIGKPNGDPSMPAVGLGTDIIAALARQLEGRVEIFRCRQTVPVLRWRSPTEHSVSGCPAQQGKISC